jgi:hypothetical protein
MRAAISLPAAILLVAGCIGAVTTTIKGDIRDDGITLATDHAGSSVRLSLQNVGRAPCDLAVVIAPMPANALPVENGQVSIDESGAPGSVRLALGGPVGYLRVQPGEQLEYEVALEGSPRNGERIVLCNAPGDYERGRFALLRFDR